MWTEGNAAREKAVRLVDEEPRDLRSEVLRLCAEKGLTQKSVARQAGIGAAVFNRWVNAVYEGDNASVDAKVERWIDTYHKRELQRQFLPAAPEWIETPTANRVLSALTYAQFAGDIAIVYGAAGLGKTTAAKHHAQISPNVWIATMSPAATTVMTALEEIQEAVGIREVITGGGARIQRAIINRIRETHGLLIVDEAQHLVIAALDAVRALHDATGIGLALMGNEEVYSRMTGNRAPYLDRLYSRIGKMVRVTSATAEDVDALANAWKVRDPEVKNVLFSIAKKPGGLRMATKVLRLAAMFSTGPEDDLSVSDIHAAWADLGGEL